MYQVYKICSEYDSQEISLFCEASNDNWQKKNRYLGQAIFDKFLPLTISWDTYLNAFVTFLNIKSKIESFCPTKTPKSQR